MDSQEFNKGYHPRWPSDWVRKEKREGIPKHELDEDKIFNGKWYIQTSFHWLKNFFYVNIKTEADFSGIQKGSIQYYPFASKNNNIRKKGHKYYLSLCYFFQFSGGKIFERTNGP